MCTVTFVPRQGGYGVGMNRDEQRTRVPGVFPGVPSLGGSSGTCDVIGPSEPTGGRWTVSNARGVTLALLNWYAQRGPELDAPRSRGELVTCLAGVGTLAEAEDEIRETDLERFRPFRLVAFFGREKMIREWRWNGTEPMIRDHGWSPQIWASSGYDETGAQENRVTQFRAWLGRGALEDWAGLEGFHRSHEPERGALSVCMHRDEAATVSLTMFQIESRRVTMDYWGGAPCQGLNAVRGEVLGA